MNKYILLAIGVLMLSALALWTVQSGLPRFAAAQPVVLTQSVSLHDGDTYELTAAYVTKEITGAQQKMLAYNGMIPGPEIHVRQGATVTIHLKNETDMPQLLHSHGVRMANASDGSQLQQEEIPPGGSFDYVLTFPDAGVYWYHPHAGEVYGQALGLYGAFIVEPEDANYYPPVNSEHVLFLSDLPIKDGAIAILKGDTTHALMGHYGNVLLINGQEDYVLNAAPGEVLRLDIVNAANARPYRLAIAGARFKLVGGDNGAYERASWQDSVTLGPSERAIVDVMFDAPGSYEIRNETPQRTQAMGHIEVQGDGARPSYATAYRTLQRNDAVIASIDPFRSYFNKTPDKKIVLSVGFTGMMAGHMQMMGGGMSGAGAPEGGGIEWDDTDSMMGAMNAMSAADEVAWQITDAASGTSNMDIDWAFSRGTPVKIRIYNDPNGMHPMQHPIHFHGQRFLVLSIDGVPQRNLVWKDTVLVPAGTTVDILLDPSNPGTWMAHCHISEHLVAGMMFAFRVE